LEEIGGIVGDDDVYVGVGEALLVGGRVRGVGDDLKAEVVGSLVKSALVPGNALLVSNISDEKPTYRFGSSMSE
jgi:hypothetical protein